MISKKELRELGWRNYSNPTILTKDMDRVYWKNIGNLHYRFYWSKDSATLYNSRLSKEVCVGLVSKQDLIYIVGVLSK